MRRLADADVRASRRPQRPEADGRERRPKEKPSTPDGEEGFVIAERWMDYSAACLGV